MMDSLVIQLVPIRSCRPLNFFIFFFVVAARLLHDREWRREERKRIIAERQAIRSRANSISDESHSPTCPNPVLCRRYSRDIDAHYGGHASHLHSHCSSRTSSISHHALPSQLTVLRFEHTSCPPPFFYFQS